jgi:nucleoside-diphosphate-sugar epimerase
VARELEAAGYQVFGASRADNGAGSPNALWWRGDLLAPDSAGRLIGMAKPDVLVHLAWETTHGAFWDSPANSQWTQATLELARAFAASGGRRFVGLGSCAEYSWDCLDDREPIPESAARAPGIPYGAAKNACYEALSRFCSRQGVSFAWGRLFQPYGPGDRRPALVPELIRALLSGVPAPLTAGTQVRDFVYVDDAARAIAALAGAPATGAFNIATGQATAVADMALRVATAAGRPDLLRVGALASGERDPAWLVGSPRKIAAETGWRARVSLDDGVRETVRWSSAREEPANEIHD